VASIQFKPLAAQWGAGWAEFLHLAMPLGHCCLISARYRGSRPKAIGLAMSIALAPTAGTASTRRAVLLMLGAMACFVINDTLVKTLSSEVPVGEIVLVRGAMTALMIALIVRAQGMASPPRQMFAPAVCVRASLDALGTLLFITALAHMQIANLTAVLQAVPLTVTLLGALFLGESVGWRRWSAIATGFAGVLLIVKPSPSGLSLYEVCAIGVVLCVALRDLVTKRIDATIPSSFIALANAVFVTLFGGIVCFFQGVVPLSVPQFLVLAAAAVFLGLGYLCMVATLRAADLSTTAPARYSIIVFAIISGALVFGQFPDGWALTGIGLIAASGLYAMQRERLRERHRMTPI
jgi:drug/metabolite transporter (DMT)-like permease